MKKSGRRKIRGRRKERKNGRREGRKGRERTVIIYGS